MAPQKINVKERFSDGEIDLSMSDLQDVPVKEIAVFKQAYTLDVSNNNLKTLPPNFASLTQLTKLDLSKNLLTELPENFGDLVKLRFLDLYQNQLQYLPLSFSKLKALKWLDLKDNPLVPQLAKVSGPCLDAKQCQTCSKDVVNFFAKLQEKVDSEIESRNKHRQKQLEINQEKQMESKKNKKKEKSNKQQQKKENVPPVATKEIPQKASNNKRNKKVINKKGEVKKSSSCVKCLVALFFIAFAALFVSTSIKCEHTRSVETAVTGLFVQGVQALPHNFKEYPILAGSYVALAHEKTGNVTLFLIQYVKNTDNFVEAYNAFGEVIGNLLNKTKEQYKKFVS